MSTSFPLKILCCIASPVDLAPLDSAGEMKSIERQLRSRLQPGSVEFTVCEDASLNEIQELLLRDAYHVVHFCGHGGVSAASNRPYLAFSSDQRKTLEVSAQQFAVLLQPHDSIRLVVLNACDSATPGRQAIGGIAQTLITQGVPAVVAMQREITDCGAVAFASALYASIANDLPVDESLALARRTLYLGGATSVEWPVACMYSRSIETRLFDLPQRDRRLCARPADRGSPPVEKLTDAMAKAIFTTSMRYVDDAGEQLAALRASRHVPAQALDRFAGVLDFVSAYVAAHARLDLGEATNASVLTPETDDDWTRIGFACRCITLGDREGALRILEGLQNEVAGYLRGLCHFRMGRATFITSERRARYGRAIEEFGVILNRETDSECERSRLLRVNSFCWFAIMSFYMEDFALAESSFAKGLQLARGAERARCMNGHAFVHLATGDFGRSESALLMALESDFGYPLARSNFGYVLLTRGDFDAAESVFGALVSDPELRDKSPKDVVLARLALVHLAESRGEESGLVYQLYLNIVADVYRVHAHPLTFSHLALAQIRLRVSEQIYLSERFNGLEVFALAILARAYLDLTAARSSDEATLACVEQIVTCIQKADCPIGWRFYSASYGGWFRSIVEYRNRLESRLAA